ncbi:UDP-2,4-diacetamido-2,4,6-trideoxy-beta-L-altropyranose hydrolase [Flavobacterium pallidum]|uniref:UDP-2,4-diacetamido-2,4, 6-trideoxy-beta-L-altropyranose hydrolase n=1 Tax=Flavobacterium pallidum TaxID=2172098 RepID=A0A2S1SDJ8_9FLAO|nr:UDP-2,4-diacetamido-2,4,6-trideoxy-beta-L-altropyranose hydrolase [Flavobacterium pallidum]AWI24459.1 UDP-2,4-diacetamido-2,4,6-trideoxy-beta-L-altropyranose hydrolase [Flavobacterium pallidum]
MKKQVFFRADGSAQTGLGHLVRCLALAQMLQDDFDIEFVCMEIPDIIKQDIITKDFSVREIASENDFINSLPTDAIVIIDHYGLNVDFHKAIIAKDCKVICIDDLHEKEFHAHVIINHAPGISEDDYKALPDTKFALGPDYALLRPAFLEAAKTSEKKNKIKTVLICFGGSDYLNLTQKITAFVAGLRNDYQVFVITGAAYAFTEELSAYCAAYPEITHFSAIPEKQMLDLMKKSDLAIVPSSGIVFEALAAGCKVMSSWYVDNQREIFDGFRDLQAIIPLESFEDISEELFLNIENIETRQVIDGLSGKRLLQLISEL